MELVWDNFRSSEGGKFQKGLPHKPRLTYSRVHEVVCTGILAPIAITTAVLLHTLKNLRGKFPPPTTIESVPVFTEVSRHQTTFQSN